MPKTTTIQLIPEDIASYKLLHEKKRRARAEATIVELEETILGMTMERRYGCAFGENTKLDIANWHIVTVTPDPTPDSAPAENPDPK